MSTLREHMYLQNIEATNFGCLRDVKIEFTPLHALIGPNDSGKSTILWAVRTLTQFLAMAAQPRTDRVSISDHGLDPVAGSRLVGQFSYLRFEVAANPGPSFHVGARYGTSVPAEDFVLSLEKGKGEPTVWGILARNSEQLVQAIAQNPDLADRVTKPASLIRLDPDALRQASDLIPEKDLVGFYDQGAGGMRGIRLPGIYDAILNRGDDAFSKIAQKTKDLFPTVRNLRLRTVSSSQKCLEIELANGQKVPAAQMSEGLLYFLAYAALPYLAPPSMLLVEEPENGLHPARIRDVVGILREISRTTQVLVATHSPLVVNELAGDEVTVVTRHAELGTQARHLSAAEDYETRSRVYAPGELWLSYADGVEEAPLFARGKTPE